jgi:6-phosphogluconolactonase/glucosamine-6-phosphate isomerase/deaminase
MEVIIQRDYEQISKAAAQIAVEVLNTKPNAVLGMATGSTPLGLYQELVRLHNEQQLDFSRVTTFNLDEGKLPCELPSSMEAVEAQRSDVPHDSPRPPVPRMPSA